MPSHCSVSHYLVHALKDTRAQTCPSFVRHSRSAASNLLSLLLFRLQKPIWEKFPHIRLLSEMSIPVYTVFTQDMCTELSESVHTFYTSHVRASQHTFYTRRRRVLSELSEMSIPVYTHFTQDMCTQSFLRSSQYSFYTRHVHSQSLTQFSGREALWPPK